MLKTDITYHRASTAEDLHQILNLQKKNLYDAISKDSKEKEGFLTVKHDFELLKKMNDACPHFIAKYNAKVVGYALSMVREFRDQIPVLIPMFTEIDKAINEQNPPLNYMVMGQVCVDKEARGQGVFRGLYQYMAQELKHKFDAIITEVDIKNKRSSYAHKAIGFKVLKNYTSNGQFWEIISLNT
ncbi:GNAT family N-acetyltransferase [Hwangdonia seohaensis]|uniref:GNAT family N-acetyltransferase n=1 Tax=Hwangdonia seohaensis TaxID=1240727 RepID=A0ABW3R9C3_9FLAO|nr:GNAT family N-acetyltransferase [Hwangdonia seohaensis]